MLINLSSTTEGLVRGAERGKPSGLEGRVDLVDVVHELPFEVIPHLRLVLCFGARKGFQSARGTF